MSSYDPMSVRLYKWTYAWQDIKDLYIQQQKEVADRTNAFCEFLVQLTSAAFGGSSKDPDALGMDDGDGLDDVTDEQLEEMREMLGDSDFDRLYGHLV